MVVRPALIAAPIEVLEADGTARKPGKPRVLGASSTSSTRSITRASTPPGAVRSVSTCTPTTPPALRALEAITAGLQWRAAQAPLVSPATPARRPRRRLGVGGALAAGLTPRLDGSRRPGVMPDPTPGFSVGPGYDTTTSRTGRKP